MISNKKFTDIYNKIINDLESLKSFYFNRYILELEFATLNFILGELLVSTLNLYNIVNTIKKDNRGNNRSLGVLIKSVNDVRLLINKLILLIVISFSNDENNDDKDDFTCNNEEYNLNFFSTNKENYNTIKIINDNFKIITQNIEDIKKNNKLVLDNIKINILFNKIKNRVDTINELYLQILSTNMNAPIEPTIIAPKPTTIAPKPTTIAPKPTTIAPKPTTIAPKPTTIAPKPTTIAPKPTFPIETIPVQLSMAKVPLDKPVSITFKQFCSLNNKNKIKVIIKLMLNIIKNIDYKEINFYNTAIFTFMFFLCFY